MCFGKEVLKSLFCRHRENLLDVSERKYLRMHQLMRWLLMKKCLVRTVKLTY
jgi:hypothetical protein